jgi:DNA-binding LacI/PurR family transcriptional regulator
VSKPRATLKSIAADLGITHTSVAHAFNNPEKISDALREKILKHAKSVNYHGPNPAARSLRTGRCGAIGIIFNDNLGYAFSDAHDLEFLKGVSSVCEEFATNIVLIPLRNPTVNPHELISAMVDGYILNATYKSNPSTQQALTMGLPAVLVDFENSDHISVLANDADAMKEITEHILSLGHKHIAVITFPLERGSRRLFTLDEDLKSDNYNVTQRILGCRRAIEESDVESSSVIVLEALNGEKGGTDAAQKLLGINPLITAFICLSDRLAYGAMSGCNALGLDVPSRISVTGFDGMNQWAGGQDLPPLTTIRQDAFDKGAKAARALLSKDEANTNSKTIKVDTTMVIDGSTARVGKRR